MAVEFTEKNVIITGGCGGIGKCLAFEFLQKGAKAIGLFDLVNTNNTIDLLKNEFPDRSVQFYKTDVTNKSNIAQSFDLFKKDFQHIDIVVVGAGIMTEHEIEKQININLLGAINTILIAMDHMSISNNGNGGTIVTISSSAGLDFPIFLPSYTATKHGILAFTKSMANKINTERHGIKFIIICPGGTETELLNKDKFDRIFLPDFLSAAKQRLENAPLQKPEMLAKLTMEPIVSGKNGSIWRIWRNQLKEYVPQNINKTIVE